MLSVGHVDSEGGPLLIGATSALGAWRGVEDDGADHERACRIFDRDPALEGGLIEVGDQQALLREMGGAGTAFVFRAEGGSARRCRIE